MRQPSFMLTIYRVRGYQFRSEGKGGPRKNPVAYRPLGDEEDKLPNANFNVDADDLEELGFAEKTEIKTPE